MVPVRTLNLPLTKLAVFISIVFLLILITPAMAEDTPAIDDETCLDCHEQYDRTLRTTPHRLSSEIDNPAIDMACINCHRGGDRHIDDPSIDNITNPASGTSLGVIEACTECHQPHEGIDQVGFDPHLAEGLTCVSCHQVHGGSPSLLVDDSGKFCGRCHTGIKRQFESWSNHPINDGVLTCWSCHNFKGGYTATGVHGSESCRNCHGEHSGPFIFEHDAGSSFTPETNGCIECHSPHGSSNDRLLTQPGDGLCRQCHGLMPRHLVAHDGIGGTARCIDCHSDIHGSNDNPNFLDPMLGTIAGDGPDDCYCHSVNR